VLRFFSQLAIAIACLAASRAHAFCGFYVKPDDDRITSRASRVVLLRDGTTTVLSMQSTYEGPPEDFALIVPVSSPISERDVRTLDREVFDRIDQLTSPRLVEYWQERPICAERGSFYGRGIGSGYGTTGYGLGSVHIEAQFAVGEYDVVVLGAEDSSALESWLRREGYRVPDGAADALRPYVAQGYRFFAARVDARRVRFERGRALLSPLRIRMTSGELVLPVRLGMLSSPGTQDLVVYVISRDGRFEVRNRPNVMVPTNIEVRGAVRGRFASFYDSLLDRVWSDNDGAVITEYAWDASSCDPCPGPTLSAEDLTSLGGDVASGAIAQPRAWGMAYGPTITLSGPALGDQRIATLFGERRAALAECVDEHTSFTIDLRVRGAYVREVNVAPESPAARCVAGVLRGALIEPGARDERVVRTSLSLDRAHDWVQTSSVGFTITRMRYRYGLSSPADDLVFARAEAIDGGTGEPDERGHMPQGVRRASGNTFQARYAILHRRPAPRCRDPIHTGWGGPPGGDRPESARALRNTVRRSPRPLRELVRTPIPMLGIEPRRRRGQ
jgi:hypothetical protein